MARELLRPEQFAKADPAYLISDDVFELSPEQRTEIEELYAGIFENFRPGALLTGTIIRKDSDGLLIDINYKSDGFISRHEFSENEIRDFNVGSPIEVMLDQLENVDGNVVLSYEKAKELRAWDIVTKLFNENKPVEGMVTHKVKGGLSVDIGIPAFLPGSQIDLQRVTNFDQYVGQSITANILKINKKRGNVIISRRKYLSEARSESRKKVLDILKEGQILPGTVKNITNYGVFIDIGGVDGLLHITDMTWGRISHPSELLNIGDQITVKVLSFDKDNEKISLGLKQLSENPWEQAASHIKIGDKIKGTVSSIADYGLFVEVAKGVEGLVHISEISWTDRITDLHKKFRIGDSVEVLVVSFDKDNRRMSLSIKQLGRNPWESIDQQFSVGQKIKGTISNITDFGIFVQLMPGIDGLVHISDLSWTEHIDHPLDLFARGDMVEAVILAIDKDNKKVSLGIKQLQQDPWESIEQQYPVGTMIEGEVSKIAAFGAFVKLPTGIEGLVHISELADKQVEKVDDVLKVGQREKFRVINVNRAERKLGLSLKSETASRRPEQPSAESAPAARPAQQKEHKAAAAQAQQQQQKEQQQSAPKTKNAFQLELEKHAERQRGKKSKADGQDSSSDNE